MLIVFCLLSLSFSLSLFRTPVLKTLSAAFKPNCIRSKRRIQQQQQKAAKYTCGDTERALASVRDLGERAKRCVRSQPTHPPTPQFKSNDQQNERGKPANQPTSRTNRTNWTHRTNGRIKQTKPYVCCTIVDVPVLLPVNCSICLLATFRCGRICVSFLSRRLSIFFCVLPRATINSITRWI